MRLRAKIQANRSYEWMQENPVTVAFVSAGGAAMLAIALTAALGLYSSVTFQAKTACSNPNSAECAEQRLDVAKAEPLRNPCASFQRVTSRRGRNCDQFYVPRKPSSGEGAGLTPNGSEAGEAPDEANAGAPAPVATQPNGSGGDVTPGKGGDSDPPPAAAPPVIVVPPPVAIPPPATPAESSKGAGEQVGKAVDDTLKEAGNAVAGTLEGVNQKGCELLGTCAK